MKNKTLPYLIITIFFTFIFLSCAKESDENEKNIIDLGTHFLQEESLDKVPYFDKSKIVFIDSLDNEIELLIEEKEIQNLKFNTSRNNVFEAGDTIIYSWLSDYKEFQIFNDSISIYFELDIYAQPFRNEFENKYFFDGLNIVSKQSKETVAGNGAFTLKVSKRDYPNELEYNKHSEINILGYNFKDVFYMKSPYYVNIVLYNYEFGIVSFKDHSAKTWVFKSME